MTLRALALSAVVLAGGCLPHAAPGARAPAGGPPAAARDAPDASGFSALEADLDRIFSDTALARALVAADVVSLDTGAPIYRRHAGKLVIPASNMKLITVAVAGDRLGWDYRYTTTLEAAGTVDGGTLHGDLIVTGSGDPAIGSPDGGEALLFLDWADALARGGITRVDGRIIGDDNAFDDAGPGAGWAWDYLAAGYAAPSGALSYNENVAVLRIRPGPSAGTPAIVDAGPPGFDLAIDARVETVAAPAPSSIAIARPAAGGRVTVSGAVAAGSAPAIRTVAAGNPTLYFVSALASALESRGIRVSGGAWDIDDVPALPADTPRRLIAEHRSAPLSELSGYAMKVSQNFYGEMLLKTLGRMSTGLGSAESGRAVVAETLGRWGIPADAYVMIDGSGLSRYNYVTAETLVAVLAHAWQDERLRGPFVAGLPVGGHDGTLESRMKDAGLDRRVQAKTGSINNVRALSGYLLTDSGERLAFSIVVNHYTAPTAAIDALVERALGRLARLH